MQNWNESVTHSDWLLPDYVRANAKSYMDWIGPALIRHNDTELLRDKEQTTECAAEITAHPSKWKVTMTNVHELLEEIEEDKAVEDEQINRLRSGLPVSMQSPLKAQVESQLYWNYPYTKASLQRSKQSVSEIKRLREQQDPYAEQTMIRKEKDSSLTDPPFTKETAITYRGGDRYACCHAKYQAELGRGDEQGPSAGTGPRDGAKRVTLKRTS